MLNLPNIGRKWKGTCNAPHYYALAYTIIPGCSEKYLQMAIPRIIGAFFYDIDITRYFKSDDLQFIANLTPCNKNQMNAFFWTENIYFYKISTYIEYGAMGHLSHDKGEIATISEKYLPLVDMWKRFILIIEIISLIPVGTTA